jgi:hypothetical protein
VGRRDSSQEVDANAKVSRHRRDEARLREPHHLGGRDLARGRVCRHATKGDRIRDAAFRIGWLEPRLLSQSSRLFNAA